MNKPNIILIGGGGHCKACIDVIEQENKFSIVGIIDVQEKVGQKILGYPIIGSDSDLPQLSKKYDYFFITIGQIKSADLKTKLFNQVKELGKNIPTIVSPHAYISKHSSIGEGTIVMHQALINSAALIGSNCIINNKALIEHEVVIGNNCHISTGAIINGNCTISSNTFIGSGAILNQGISVTKNCIVGSGSVILKDIKQESTTWVGSPATMKS
jgi:sugar O-acyltransferase (sialic acid O-acetyltransferase NeuD family)